MGVTMAFKKKRLTAQNKYGAKSTIIDGITFDSKGEAERYLYLKALQRDGLISDLVLQPRFLLQDGFELNGSKELAIVYIADFQYHEKGKMVVEDFKGVETNVFRLKRKLFLRKYCMPDKNGMVDMIFRMSRADYNKSSRRTMGYRYD